MRILFIDYWTQGIHNFTRLVESSEHHGEYGLLHLGSYLDPTTPRVEIIHNIPCFDIAAFRGLSLKEILRSLHPNAVVVLNIGGLFDRAICLTCRALSIPVVFVQHGVWAEGKEFAALCESIDTTRSIREKLRVIPKYLRLIPWYRQVCDGGLAGRNFWRVLFQIAKGPAIARYFPVCPEEVWPTLACVFAGAYRDMLLENVRMPRERIVVTGNPELDRAAQHRACPRPEILRNAGFTPGIPVVCFMEEALVEQQGLFGWTDEFREQAIEEIYEACRSAGAQMLVRPHPGMRPGAAEVLVRAFSGRPGIAITRAPSLFDTLACSDVIVGCMSTTLETAIVLGKPILVPLWHINGDAAFSAYLRYGAATPIADRSELKAAIERALRHEWAADPSRYAAHRLGPTDGRAASRIMDNILRVASGARCPDETLECTACS